MIEKIKEFIENQQNKDITNFVCNECIDVGTIKSKNGRKAIIVIKAIYDEEEQEDYL